MEFIARLTREYSYNAWANREALRSLQKARQIPERGTETLAHIIGSEHHWLRRLGHESRYLPIWPALSLSQCHEHLHELLRAWASYLARLTSEALHHEVKYVTTPGQEQSNSVVDILGHVLLHSAHYRGQIAGLLARAQEKPAATDYIEWVQRGHSESEPTSSCSTHWA
jgi:uncharacterized damage-inducible protein DinB